MRGEQAIPAKHPILEMLTIAAPTVATMTSYTLMQFTDKIIVSRIGPEPVYVGAQGNGGLAAFIPISIAMGALQVINTYVSQNLGAGRPERGPAYAWNGLWLAAAFWLFILVPYGFALPSLFDAMGHDAERVALESVYGQILIFGAVLTMSTRALSQFFYGMHRAGVVLAAGVVSNVINLVLTWALVFGVWGFPKLGIAGSAIGTVIATGIELSIPMAVFLGPRLNRLYATRSSWRPSLPHMRDLWKIGWPGGLMFGNEMACWGVFMVVYVGGFGKHHSTAGWIAHQYMSLSFMPAVGISVAATALVGKYMGMRRPDLAAHRAWLGVKVAIVYMGVCAMAFIVFRRPLVRLFIDGDTPPETADELVRLGSAFLIAAATFQVFDALAMTLSGALRGAGDTVVPGLVTVVLSWTVIVGGGFAMIRGLPHLGSLGPWIAASVYIAILGLFLLWRFVAGPWRRFNLLAHAEGSGGDDAVPTAEPESGLAPADRPA